MAGSSPSLKNIRKLVVLLFSVIFLTTCSDNSLQNNVRKTYKYLPENLIARSSDGRITARYVNPTTRYGHGVLGDRIEAGGLLVVKNNTDYYIELDSHYVFEDLQPRLRDINNDGEPEFITIQSSVTEGASVAVYAISGGKLSLLLQSKFIGSSNKWLNIAAIEDLDNDGQIEIAWVETPHGPGILTIATIENDKLRVIDVFAGASNHKTGSRNLCLSAVTSGNSGKLLYLPSRNFDSIIGFSLENGKIIKAQSISQLVDPDVTLSKQFEFDARLNDANCINVE